MKITIKQLKARINEAVGARIRDEWDEDDWNWDEQTFERDKPCPKCGSMVDLFADREGQEYFGCAGCAGYAEGNYGEGGLDPRDYADTDTQKHDPGFEAFIDDIRAELERTGHPGDKATQRLLDKNHRDQGLRIFLKKRFNAGDVAEEIASDLWKWSKGWLDHPDV